MTPPGVLGTLTLPPRLALRALDDLHEIALAAREATGALSEFRRRASTVERQIERGLDLLERIETMGERMDRRARAILALGERIEDRADGILALGERVDTRAEAIIGMGQRIEQTGAAVLTQGEAIEQAAHEVSATGAALAAALPTLQRGLELAEPLEGVVERVGRMVDRLPGGPRRPVQAPPD